jgi:hypothetical protein
MWDGDSPPVFWFVGHTINAIQGYDAEYGRKLDLAWFQTSDGVIPPLLISCTDPQRCCFSDKLARRIEHGRACKVLLAFYTDWPGSD